MNSLILYFSGTGNTHLIAEKIKQIREKQGETIILLPIEQISHISELSFERIYIGFPVYGLTVPPFFMGHIEKLLPLNCEVYLFATAAYAQGNALYTLSQKISAGGGRVIGGRSISMPGSDGIGFMKKDSPTVQKMINRDFDSIPELDLIKEDLRRIDNGDRRVTEITLPVIKRFSLRCIVPIMSFAEKSFCRKLNADEHCTGCRLCEKICPVENISVTNQSVTFRDHCTLCMRCIHHCPTEAINIGSMTKGKYKYRGPGEKRFRPIKLFNTGSNSPSET